MTSLRFKVTMVNFECFGSVHRWSQVVGQWRCGQISLQFNYAVT